MNEHHPDYGSAGCTNPAAQQERPQTQVTAYIKELNSSLSVLDTCLSQHINVITPVLTEAKPSSPTDKKEVAERICPVATQLRSLNDRVNAIRQRLETTTSLVQA